MDYTWKYTSLCTSLSLAVVNTSTPEVGSPWKPQPSSSSPDHHWVTNESSPDPWEALPTKTTSKSTEQPWRSPVHPGTAQDKQNYRYRFTQTMETVFIWHLVCIVTKPQQELTHFPFMRKRNQMTNDLTVCSALAVRVQQVLQFLFLNLSCISFQFNICFCWLRIILPLGLIPITILEAITW